MSRTPPPGVNLRSRDRSPAPGPHSSVRFLRCQRLHRRLKVHAHDAATGHYLACGWRLTAYDLARANELRYQSAQENVFACERGGLKRDIGNFGKWKWIIVRES